MHGTVAISFSAPFSGWAGIGGCQRQPNKTYHQENIRQPEGLKFVAAEATEFAVCAISEAQPWLRYLIPQAKGAVSKNLWPQGATLPFSLTLTLSRWEREQPSAAPRFPDVLRAKPVADFSLGRQAVLTQRLHFHLKRSSRCNWIRPRTKGVIRFTRHFLSPLSGALVLLHPQPTVETVGYSRSSLTGHRNLCSPVKSVLEQETVRQVDGLLALEGFHKSVAAGCDAPVLPHPDPLPLGEGTAVGRSKISGCVTRQASRRFFTGTTSRAYPATPPLKAL
jgi:hypothetical protein